MFIFFKRYEWTKKKKKSDLVLSLALNQHQPDFQWVKLWSNKLIQNYPHIELSNFYSSSQP